MNRLLTIIFLSFSFASFGQASIGIAKSVEPLGREQVFTLIIENLGNENLTTIQVLEDLDAVFGTGNYSLSTPPTATGTLVANPSFNGSSNTNLLNSTNSYLNVPTDLEPRSFGTLTFGVTIDTPTDQGIGFGIYSNQVTVTAEGSTSGSVSDLSDWNTDPDSNGNGDAGDANENDPTLIDLFQNPLIGVAKSASMNGNQATFRFNLENLGNRDLQNLSLVDNLDAVLGAGNYSINTVPSFFDNPETIILNEGYNGSSSTDIFSSGTLGIGETAGIEVVIDITNVTDQGLGLGVYKNQATASGNSSGGKTTQDLSDEGTEPDINGNGNAGDPDENDPTNFIIGEEPAIGVAKQVSIVADSVIINIVLENLGNTPLNKISVTEDLNAVFGVGNYNIRSSKFIGSSLGLQLNPHFDGNFDNQLVDNTVGSLTEAGVVTLQIVVENIILSDQGLGLGNYENQVYAVGFSPSNVKSEDYSDDGTDPDPNGNSNANEIGENDKSSFSIAAKDEIGIALEYKLIDVTSGIYTVEFLYHVENLGNRNVNNITISNNLNAVFGAGNYIHLLDPTAVSGSNTFNYNSGYNGNSNTSLLNAGSSLGAGESISFKTQTRITNITDQGFGVGIYQSSVTLNGLDPQANPISDISTKGNNVDPNGDGDPAEADPTPIDLNGDPSIGIALTASVSGSEVTFDFFLENLGNLNFSSLSLTTILDNVFGPGNYNISSPPTFIDNPGTISLNSSFDGTSENQELLNAQGSSLAVDETAQIRLKININNITNFQGLGAGNYSLQSTFSGLSEYGGILSDLSDLGTDPDPNGNGDANEAGENDATTFTIAADFLGIAQKAAISGKQVTLDLYFENLSLSTLSNLSIADNLDETFGKGNYTITTNPTLIIDPGTITLNGSFDGSTNTDILSSSSTLSSGAVGQIQLVVNVDSESDQGSGYGVYNSQVVISGSNPSGLIYSDNSDDGLDPDPNGNDDPSEAGEDDPTAVIITGSPAVGIAKQVIVNGTTLTFIFTIENLGDVTLTNFFMQDPLNPVFGSGNYSIQAQPAYISGASTLTLSPQFFGFNIFDRIILGGYLRPGEKEVFRTTISVNTVTDQGNGFGIYNNQVTVTATDPGGNSVSDLSDSGFIPDANSNGNAGDAGEDDFTEIIIGDEANIGISLNANVTGNLVTLDYYLENLGASNLSSLSLANDLDAVFGVGNYIVTSGPSFIDNPGTIALNLGFDGSGDKDLISSGTLNGYDTGQIRVVIEVTNVTNRGQGKGYFTNQVFVSALAPLGSKTSDYSDFGTDPDPNGDGFPFGLDENDSTFFIINFTSIGHALNLSVDCKGEITFTYNIQNLGTTALDSINLQLDLDAIFGSGNYSITESPKYTSEKRSLFFNESFNGSSNDSLLLQTSTMSGNGIETIVLKVSPNNPSNTLYTISSTINATNSENLQISDVSDSGFNPDTDGDKIADENGENDPTLLQTYAQLSATISSQTNVSCNGLSDGAATVSVTGGTTNYSYSWTPAGGSLATANNLAAGTYSVTVTDANGCNASATVNITQPNVLSATISSQTNVSCNGLSDGAATVSVTGGTTNYSYSW
ncbi:MAG: SprB repeat-containing protein, partial [Cytophagales bacterium]|nr:SprB repeat-containing protein [Cytophagales bacterium]